MRNERRERRAAGGGRTERGVRRGCRSVSARRCERRGVFARWRAAERALSPQQWRRRYGNGGDATAWRRRYGMAVSLRHGRQRPRATMHREMNAQGGVARGRDVQAACRSMFSQPVGVPGGLLRGHHRLRHLCAGCGCGRGLGVRVRDECRDACGLLGCRCPH